MNTNLQPHMVRQLYVSLLTYEQGISQESYGKLLELMVQFEIKDIAPYVNATDGRFYLSENWSQENFLIELVALEKKHGVFLSREHDNAGRLVLYTGIYDPICSHLYDSEKDD